MGKTEIIQRICELDRAARLDSLISFTEADLEFHLQLLLRGARWSDEIASQMLRTTPPVTATDGSNRSAA